MKDTSNNLTSAHLAATFHALLQRWYVIALVFGFAVFFGVLFLWWATPVYEATVILQVEQRQRSAMGANVEEDLRSLEMLKSYEQALQRVSLWKQVLERPEFRDRAPYRPYFAAAEKDPNVLDNLANSVAKQSDVKLRSGTRLIDVSIRNPNPELARDLANAAVEVFMQEYVQFYTENSTASYRYLLQEAERMRLKLEKDEQTLQAYQLLTELHGRIDTASLEVSDLDRRYLEKHPRMIQAKQQLASLEEQFRVELNRVNKILQQPEREPLPIEEELQRQESKYQVVSRELAANRAVYEALLQQMKQASLQLAAEPVNIRVLEWAFLPSKPVWPKTILILGCSVLLGLVGGVLAALGLDALDTSIRTVDMAEAILGLPVLGAICVGAEQRQLAKQRRKARSSSDAEEASSILMLAQPGSPEAEHFRSLRARTATAEAGKITLFTSAVPQEGKTFCCVNYAVAAVQSGQKTLLMNTDLRQPRLQEELELDRDAPGISEWVDGQAELGEICQSTVLEDLDFVGTGKASSNPAELLAGKRFQELIDKLAPKYDRVIIDTAPIISVSDALGYLSLVDSVLLVVRAGKTPRGVILRALNELENAQASPLGVVLNFLPRSSGHGTDPYYYYYAASGVYGEAYQQGNQTR